LSDGVAARSRWDWRQRRDSAVAVGRDVADFMRVNSSPICLAVTLGGIALWAVTFATLGVRHHRNFGTWAFDMAIYDQAFWLVSRGGDTWMTVRGMDVWGHHLNLIAYLFAPFYRWFGAGPSFLYVVQNVTIALGALPVYLIARHRFGGADTARRWWAPYVGLTFAIAFLLYPSAQFIAWINFHPEAMVITPFLFAWYFAIRRRWAWFFVAIVVALALREDVALAVIFLGIVLFVVNWRSPTRDRDLKMAAGTVALGFVWYLVSTQLILPHFNDGEPPFYISYFFKRYGGSFSGIARNIIRHPDWVISDATQPDRMRFYRDLGLPVGGLPLAAPLHLLMAAPQMLASVIGEQVYARQILYQYPSVMVAPIFIAAIEGGRWLWDRFRFVRRFLVPWLLVCAYASNVAWSNSPIGSWYRLTWAQDNPRRELMEDAVDLVPDDAAVVSTYNFGPHFSQREESYDWPNPFWPSYWGNEAPGVRFDCRNFPSAARVDYLVVDRLLFLQNPNDPIARDQLAFIDGLIARNGQFEAVMDEQDILVARRVEPGPDGDALAPNCPGTIYDAFELNEIDLPAPTTNQQQLPAPPPASSIPRENEPPTTTVP
jgi:uncharacterized membrane protein